MKKEYSTLSKRLKQYSALAGSIVAVTGAAHGQVMYTNIPDTVFTAVNPFPGDTLPLDLNNDGTTDFNFVVWKSSTYVAFGLKMSPFTASNPNAIAGDFGTLYSHPLGMAYQLSLNDNIDANLDFFNFNQLVFSTSLKYIPIMFNSRSGNPMGHWQVGETDHFAGFKFTFGGFSHYGWARVDITTDSSITLKDYAYNSASGQPLFAGQGSPLGISSANPSGNFNILAYEGVVNIFVNDGKPEGSIVTVTNMLGETIIKQSLTNRTSRIDINQYAKGIYLVSVQRGEESFSKKISFR